MHRVLILLFSIFLCQDAGAVAAQISPSTKTIVSIDSPYQSTGDKKHNYRYRAIFNQDVPNEVPGTLRVEKVQLPDGVGGPHSLSWSVDFDLNKHPVLRDTYKSLPFESAIGCCGYSEVRWSNYRLEFKVEIAARTFSCTSSDVSKAKPTFECR